MPLKKRYYTVNEEILGERTATGRVDYLQDAIGSVVATTNGSGAVLSTDRYGPFGADLQSTGSRGAFGWLGGWGYRESGLEAATHYVRARFYVETYGRWRSVDPYWPSEPAYVYVGDNPTTRIDPQGLQPVRTNMGYGGDCCGLGGLEWAFELKNESRNGWLIQRVTRTEGATKCGGGKLGASCPSVYFEAWKVQGGQVLVPAPNGGWTLPIGVNPDHWEFVKGGGCTFGSHSISGELMFLAGSLPANFKRNNPQVKCAHELPASLTFTGWKSQGAPGKFSITWGCCGKKPKCPPTKNNQCDKCKVEGSCIDPSVSVSPKPSGKPPTFCPS